MQTACARCASIPARIATRRAGEPTQGETQYETTATQHTASYKLETPYTCPDCGHKWTEEEAVKGTAEAHEFESGVCTVCGYECQHDQQTAGTAQQGELLGYEATAEQHTPVYRNTTPLYLRSMRRDGKDG